MRQRAAALNDTGGARSLGLLGRSTLPFTVQPNPTATSSETDVFSVEKQARIYPGGALWPMSRPPFFIVVGPSISPAHVLMNWGGELQEDVRSRWRSAKV